MGFISNYLKNNKRKEEEQLEKLLNQNVFDIDTNAINNSSNLEINTRKDRADEIILSSYDRKSFLKELRKQIKPQVLDDMSNKIDIKNNKNNKEEKEQKKEIEEKTKSIKNPEELKKELDDEKIKEDTPENLNLKADMIKSVYINTAKKYYSLIEKLQEGKNGQVKTGSIVNGSKYDNELIMYQFYMRKLDLWYRTVNHGNPIGFDPEVQETIQNLEYKKTKNDSITNTVRENNIKKIEQLNNELEIIEEKMVSISNIEDDKFSSTEELGILKKEYASKKLELSLLVPSLGIVYAENNQKEKNEEKMDRLGINLDDKYSGKIYGQKLNSMRNYEEYKQDKSTNDIEQVVHEDMISDNIEKVEEAITKFDEAMNEGRYEDAIQSISAAGEFLATASDAMEVSDDDMQTFEEAKLEAQRIKRNEIEEERNNAMGIGAIYTESEIFAKDIAEALYSKRDKYKNEAERIKNNNERCR